jgi:hypothetical protein
MIEMKKLTDQITGCISSKKMYPITLSHFSGVDEKRINLWEQLRVDVGQD